MAQKWQLAYASVLGNSHIKEGLPCQDAHFIHENESNIIAVVCDGAGSCPHSEIGAEWVSNFIGTQLAYVAKTEQFIENQKDTDWKVLVYDLIKTTQLALAAFAESEKYDYKDLSCTVIAAIVTPEKLLTFHIGDGRGGYMDADGDWKSFMTPFHGAEANETVFVTSSIWENPEIYIETNSIQASIHAFCLLSDGCEKASFLCNLYDEVTEKYSDPNLPFPPFFNPNIAALKSLSESNTPQDDVNTLWETFLTNGNTKLSYETDDKTLVLGVLV